MSMVWVARLADDAQTAEIRANPNTAYDFINAGDEVEDVNILYLDKDWHAAHHLLTGTAEPVDSPLGLILGKFEQIGSDNGYGPAWFIPANALRAFSEASASLDESELRSRYDPDAMAKEQVYIGDAYQEEGEEGFPYLLQRVEAMRKFADCATASGKGAFAVIT